MNSDCAGMRCPRRIMRKNDGDMTNLGHDRIRLIGRALPEATWVNVNVCDDLAAVLAAIAPEFSELSPINVDDARLQGVRINVVVKDEFLDLT